MGYWCYGSLGVVGIATACAIFATTLCAPWLQTHFVYYQRFLSCFALGLLVPTGMGAAVARRLPAMSWLAVLVAMLASRHVVWAPPSPDGKMTQLVEQRARESETGVLARLG
ncbi:MAG TPA: hypothetical protein VN829_01035 [Dongiaceae bacterium]|nr:hypothetical protein [Dongiaceae bacterium]